MDFLLFIFGLAACLWLASLVRHNPRVPDWVLPTGLIAVLFLECVFGAGFLKIEVGPIPVTLDRVLLGGLIGSALYKCWQEWNGSLRFSILDLVVVVWIGVLTVSALSNDYGFRNNLPLTRLLFFNLLPVALYFVARQVNWREHWLESIQWGCLVLGLFLAVTGVFEWRGWHGLVFPPHTVDPTVSEFLGRARGPLLNPVINGILINAGLAATMLMIWRLRGTLKLIPVLLIPFLLAGSYATLTRSVWVGTALTFGLMVLAPLTMRNRIAVCAAGLLMAAAVIGVFGDELNQFKRDRDVSVREMAQSIELRPLLATVAWEMFRDHPIAGHGFGQYSKFKRPYHYSARYDAPLTMALPYMQHNVLLSYATETGLIGLVSLVGLLGASLFVAGRLCVVGGAGVRVRQHGLFLLCLIGNYLINGMFHDVSIIPMTHSLMLLFFGIASALALQHLPSATLVLLPIRLRELPNEQRSVTATG